MHNENPLIFLFDILFDIYIMVLLLRFILQYVGADYYNPIAQFVVKATQPVVKVARRVIPSYKSFDIATLVTVILFIAIKTAILLALKNVPIDPVAVVLYSVYDLIDLSFDVFIFAIFIQAILSWVNPDPYNPVSSILSSITQPVLTPVRRIMPDLGGIDISPIFALIGLMFLKRVVLYFFQMI